TKTQIVLGVLCCVTLAGAANAQLLGVTGSDLVRIDPNDPAYVTVIGPTNLPPEVAHVYELTYHPIQRALLGIGFGSGSTTRAQFLLSFDLTTGQGTVLCELGDSDTVGNLELLEYVGLLSSLVISGETSIPSGGYTDKLLSLGTDCTTSFLVTNSLDNDYGVYDSKHGLFYTTDPNGPGQLVHVDLSNGDTENIGAIPNTLGTLAYSNDHSVIFGVNWSNNNLHSIVTTNGGAPITMNSLGIISGSDITALAYVPQTSEVEAPTVSTLGIFILMCGLLGIGFFAAKRRVKRPT
ncbi:hypothetical protein ACFL6M_07375, partial [Candidatus Eisenbacteria bacterium]